jgi:hypothetical protein
MSGLIMLFYYYIKKKLPARVDPTLIVNKPS